jgi:hypothetical protein
MHFILPHVEFEDGLSISVVKNKATCHKKLQLEIDKVFKNGQLRPPTWSILPAAPFWNACVSSSRSRVRASLKDRNTIKRVKSTRWFQTGFIDWMRLWSSYVCHGVANLV